MKKIFLPLAFITIYITFSCNSNSDKLLENNHFTHNWDTNQIYSTQNELIGIWKLHGEENSIFQIYPDSIYYTDQGQMFNYQTKGDSIFIIYNDWIDRSKFEVTKNRLIFIGELSIDTFERFIN